MFCENCGKELYDDAVMCVHCGKLLKPLPSLSAPAAPLAVQPVQPAEQSAPDEKKLNRWAIAGFVLSFCGCFGIMFSVFGLVCSIVALCEAKNLKSGKGFGISGIIISIAAFFVHGVIMMFLMPLIMRIVGGMFIVAFFILFLCFI
ncbi:MAG: hypothetical protein K2K39_01090 [Clostridia bacterium]|nr:hypothetical protein [Clostridia bacterium]